jgi:cytochrome c556
MRSSLEVLQRMANGIEPFDYNRFRCAVAALPHESPRLTASVQVQEHRVGYAGRLTEALMNKKRRELGLTVIDNEPGPEAA